VIGRFDGARWIDRSISKLLAFEIIRIASPDAIQSQICQNEVSDHHVSSAKYVNLLSVVGIKNLKTINTVREHNDNDVKINMIDFHELLKL